MKKIKTNMSRWISIGGILFLSVSLFVVRTGRCMFGEDIPFLIQIITQAIAQVRELQSIIGSAQETVGLLEEMNRGVKDVLQLAGTAHLPLPSQVYENARQIDSATQTAQSLFGGISVHSPDFFKTQYQSGVEGLYLSQDAFQYSGFLDRQGTRVKESAVLASQATATRLSAETLGVLLHAVSHQSRIEAKSLEIASSTRIEASSREESQFQSFNETHEAIEKDMKQAEFSSLNSYGDQP